MKTMDDKLLAIKNSAGKVPRIPACPAPRNGLTCRGMLKTGLIQPETIPGHFPRNLRTIVELYRSCLDGGAELVLCPPLALSGMHTGELALRDGFRSQHRAALAYLAKEIADIPLVLGAADEEGLRFHLLRNGQSFPQEAVIPHSASCTGSVPVSGIFRNTGEAGFSILPWAPSSPVPCLLLRTPSGAWRAGLLEQEEEEERRLAQATGLPVFTSRLAGGEGPFLLPGASSAWSGDGSFLGRLRLFEGDYAVISAEAPAHQAFSLPAPEEQLRHALRKGMADFIQKTGHVSACLNLLESPSPPLLAHLSREALPSLKITGLIPRLPGVPERDLARARALADRLGIHAREWTFPSHTAGEGPEGHFTAMWSMRQWAQGEGALLLSALNGTDVMTDSPLLPGALAADFMPLGDLYETELADLFPGLLTPAPEAAIRDGLLIRLHRNHESATPMADRLPEREQEIRRLQRRARASEWMRRKLPPRLLLRSAPGEPETPYVHRLMD